MNGNDDGNVEEDVDVENDDRKEEHRFRSGDSGGRIILVIVLIVSYTNGGGGGDSSLSCVCVYIDIVYIYRRSTRSIDPCVCVLSTELFSSVRSG